MKLAHDVVIFKSNEIKFKTFIGNNDVPAFISSYNGKCVCLLAVFCRKTHVDGAEYHSPEGKYECQRKDKCDDRKSAGLASVVCFLRGCRYFLIYDSLGDHLIIAAVLTDIQIQLFAED